MQTGDRTDVPTKDGNWPAILGTKNRGWQEVRHVAVS